MKEFDVIVVGSGPGGYATAASASAMGRSTMIVERGELGGTCLNRGCIPTKALSRSAEMALLAAGAAEYGVNVGSVSLDFAQAAARKNRVVDDLREGVATVLSGVTVVRGEARFVEPHVIDVAGVRYTAQQIIVATGSCPSKLQIPGAELAVDSDYMLGVTVLPENMVIVGGGVIGMEFASILAAFGVKVTVLEYCREILPGFDTDVAKKLRMALKRRGVNIITDAKVTAIEAGAVEYLHKGKAKRVEADLVMMAVGRKAVVPEGFAELGVEFDRGFIVTDDNMQTNIDGVYAVGDVNGRCLLAHAATAQGRVALGLEQNLSVIPSAVFTTPECAMVGLTGEQCVDKGIDVIVGRSIYRGNGKALAMGEPDGAVKMIIAASDHKILGCHICGAHASDLVQEVAMAMKAGLKAEDLVATVHGHPTLSELVLAATADALK